MDADAVAVVRGVLAVKKRDNHWQQAIRKTGMAGAVTVFWFRKNCFCVLFSCNGKFKKKNIYLRKY